MLRVRGGNRGKGTVEHLFRNAALFRLHLDRREANYILETSCQSNAVRLFNAMSLLMGRPLQRPLQMESSADVDKLDKRFVH